MKKLFVAVSRPDIERAAHEAEKNIGEYCQIQVVLKFAIKRDDELTIMKPILTRENREIISGILNEYIEGICMSDFCVFSDDWQLFGECRVLHHIAEWLGMSILEVNIGRKQIA